MWSNQAEDKVYFAMHVDGDPDTTWDSSKTALDGAGEADDHINLKSVQSDGGKVYAAIKTSHTSGSTPLIMALVFDPALGTWTRKTVARVSDSHTRPIILIDDEHDTANVVMSGPTAAVHDRAERRFHLHEDRAALDAHVRDGARHADHPRRRFAGYERRHVHEAEREQHDRDGHPGGQ